MSGLTRRAGIGLLASACLSLAACGELVRTQGFVPTDEDLEAVVVGRDTRGTVRVIIGPPATGGILADSGWYYVRSTFRSFAWREPEEIDREVVAISFDDAGVVTNVERFGLEDGQVIALSRRVTDSNTQGIGFLRQLFGNLGRINPANFFNNNN